MSTVQSKAAPLEYMMTAKRYSCDVLSVTFALSSDL